jgi:hypothetical protein
MKLWLKSVLALLSLATVWLIIPTKPQAAPAERNVATVAAELDRLIDARLAEAKVPASPVADDAEFCRRVSLDIRGRIPTPERVVAFLADTDPYKRAKLIDEFLADPEYGEHFATIWYHKMVKPDDDNRFLISDSLAHWLADRFNKNDGWNKIVTEILTADGMRDKNPATVFWLANVGMDKDKHPEPNKITAAASHLFLGVKLECCECHNHPFATLKQTDFWGVAAFFGQVHSDNASKKDAKAGGIPGIHEGGALKGKAAKAGGEKAPAGSIVIPDTKGKTVKAQYLLGAEAPISGKTALRPVFAAWATSASNPFFARAAVNKWWANFFGRGIVHPVDDMRPESKNTHPQLLEYLAKEFASSGFDLKHLIRCICNSQTYQRTSRPLPQNKEDEELYSHAAVRMMTADMLFDSLAVALSHAPADKAAKGANKAAKKLGGGGPRGEFRKFFHTEADDDASAVADYAHGIPQVLRLMNSTQMNNTTTVVAKLLKADPSPGKVTEELYLRVLCRRPTEAEIKKVAAYVQGDKELAKSYGDVMWALLNSAEFMFNH